MSTDEEISDEWVPITVAAREVNIPQSKLSRLVSQNKLASQKDNRDMRVTLVNLEQVRAMFPSNKRRWRA